MPTEVLSGLWFGSIDDLKHPMFFDDMNRVDVYHHRQDERWRGIRPKASGAPATCELLGNYALKNVAAACVTKMQS